MPEVNATFNFAQILFSSRIPCFSIVSSIIPWGLTEDGHRQVNQRENKRLKTERKKRISSMEGERQKEYCKEKKTQVNFQQNI